MSDASSVPVIVQLRQLRAKRRAERAAVPVTKEPEEAPGVERPDGDGAPTRAKKARRRRIR